VAASDDSEEDTCVRAPLFDRTSASSRAYAIVLTGAARGQTFPIDRGSFVIGRDPKADLVLTDDGISREHARITVVGNDLVVEDLDSTNGTWCNGERVSRRILVDGDKVGLGATTILKLSFHDPVEQALAEQLFEAARRDPLTKLFKRAYLMERLEGEVAFSRRHKVPLAVLFIDLDHFKAVNDNYGHPAGDAVLRDIASLLLRSVRPEDIAARYGGEEIVVVARRCDLFSGVELADALRLKISTARIVCGVNTLRVTASIGVAAMPSAGITDSASLLAAADRAVYRAKEHGRNMVMTP
jgi:two-component system, cell cycle response regulator